MVGGAALAGRLSDDDLPGLFSLGDAAKFAFVGRARHSTRTRLSALRDGLAPVLVPAVRQPRAPDERAVGGDGGLAVRADLAGRRARIAARRLAWRRPRLGFGNASGRRRSTRRATRSTPRSSPPASCGCLKWSESRRSAAPLHGDWHLRAQHRQPSDCRIAAAGAASLRSLDRRADRAAAAHHSGDSWIGRRGLYRNTC